MKRATVVYAEFPYKVYTYDNKMFFVDRGQTKCDGFKTLAGAIESIKYQMS